MSLFQCIALCSAEKSPHVAIAASRAGGIGILDCEFAEGSSQLLQNIQSLTQPQGQGQVGLKFHVRQQSQLEDWLSALNVENSVMIISWYGSTVEALKSVMALIEKNKSHASIFIEVTALSQVNELADVQGIAGFVAKGHECGGWVGEDAAFILSQKLVAATDLPIFTQGGIGIHTASACRAIGVAGVVLDEQLLLMPESGLAHIRPVVESLNGKECVAIGDHFGVPCRVLDLPRMLQTKAFKALRDEIDVECVSLAAAKTEWLAQANQHLGWDESKGNVWPMGQAIALATHMTDTYKTTGRLVQAMVQGTTEQLSLAKQHHVMHEGSPLAKAHQTTYPFVQGPMTRVSDTPEFAKAVADGGGLPLVALAVLKATQIDGILAKTQTLLDGQSWGVGLLGFIEQSLYEAQLQSVLKHKPPFALIAGGRPDQAKRLEGEGISTYIHAPTPELLSMFISQGARKFVFEGRECGGHIGPLSSFVLWEQMIEVLLNEMPKGKESEFQLLFAGGIHDGISAAMVNVLAASLVARGAKVGALMGTVYLFTEEAVSQGAILEEFQHQALLCENTVNLVTGPGHASRCVNTEFAEEFYETRRKLLKQGVLASEVSEHLDKLNLGRLRIASKGSKRDDSGDIVQVSKDEQLVEGMYMIGQVATLHTEKTTIAALHADIAEQSEALLQDIVTDETVQETKEQPSDIAIIGLSTLLPGAHDVNTYWDNILNKLDVISEIPAERWDWRLYFDAERKTKDKLYMKNGGFFGEVAFDPMDFGIPPNSLRTIEPIHLLTLGVVKQALEDAGYANGDFDREHTSVILGASGGLGDLGVQYAARTELDKVVGKPTQEALDRLPSWNEESFSGLLLNVAAGRVANRFDLGGTNQTVDAACGSSLAALKNAVQELESGVANVAIAGGIDAMMSPFSFMCFAKTQALSPSGTPKPFDKNGDGIVISEGISAVVLKRLADAERDGDRIYGVIKGVGSSSDGRALGMTAPLPKGQMRALDRAYHKAGYTPDTVALFEAHGTGTPAGDKAESETIISTLNKYNTKPKNSALGSVKSQIGHTKATAGTAALIKAVLSLHHKVQPPHMNVTAPLDVIADPESPVFILNQKRPWFAASAHPRRAGVSAFGFGGTNYHTALEEYTGAPSHVPAGATNWPCELFVFKASSREFLLKTMKHLHQSLAQGSAPTLRDLAAAYAHKVTPQDTVCLSLVADDLTHLQTLLQRAIDGMNQGQTNDLGSELYYREGIQSDAEKVAFMYPGQGSQYVNMGLEQAVYFDEVRGAFEVASHTLDGAFEQPLHDIIFPPSAFTKDEVGQQRAALTDTHTAQPALAAYSLGLTKLLKRLGIQADAICGHSLGEYSALCAAGVFTEDTLYKLVETRGRLMGQATTGPAGTMAAVKLSRDEVVSWLDGSEKVVVANHNAPQQTIISGEKDAVIEILENMEKKGVAARLLPVSGAFHSSLLADAQKPLAEAIKQTEMNQPMLDVYANKTGSAYAADVEEIKTQLSQHLLGSVEFVSQIETMYAAGIRIFVEVGAKNVLSNLVAQILGDKPHTCIAMDQRSGSLKGLLQAVAAMSIQMPDMHMSALFAGRGIQISSPNQLLTAGKPKPLGKTSYLVSGDKVRHHSEPKGSNGRQPMLTLETQQPMAQAVNQEAVAAQGQASSVAASANPMQDVLLSYQQTMRDFLALQEKVVTDFIQGGASANPQSSASASVLTMSAVQTSAAVTTQPAAPMMATPTEPSAAQVETVAPQQSLLATLVSIVAERTGYPEDMLDADQDMEAELGIDSIKRVEIMGTLQERLPAAMVAQLQDHMDTISRTKSLREMVEQIEALVPHSTSAETTASAGNSSVGSAASATAAPDLLPLLVSIVAERTGYPEDMLDADQDMEAELGIDSIKRVEIMGTLQERLPAAMVAQLQDHMDTISRTKSLREMVEQIEALVPHSTSVETTDSAGNSSVGSAASATAAPDLLPLLVSIVAERTGYPEDMLDADQDMEAELGIDSIKRVEIMGTLQERLPAAMVAQLQDHMDTISRTKSLREMVEQIEALSSDVPPVIEEAPSAIEKDAVTSILIDSDVPRYTMKKQPLDEPKLTEDPINGYVLLTSDRHQVANMVSNQLKEKGIEIIVLPESLLGNIQDLEQYVATLIEKEGKAITGLIHLAGLIDHADKSPATCSEMSGICNQALFAMLKPMMRQMNMSKDNSNGRVLAASLLGAHDVASQAFPPAMSASLTAMMKTVRHEHVGLHARSVDFDAEISPMKMAKAVVAEFMDDDSTYVEVAYQEGKRFTFVPELNTASDVVETQLKPDDWVILVTGGARGITAEVLKDLAPFKPTFVLVGRTPLVKSSDDPMPHADEPAEMRRLLIEQAKQAGQVTSPVAMEKALQAILSARAIRHNIEALETLGARVDYLSCDVADDVAFSGLIEGMYDTYGRIDGVIHAAGIIDDQLLVNKSSASFLRVFDTKVLSAHTLARHLRPESLKLLIFFSSISGRFGNLGQIDYAAANEVLNQLAIQLKSEWSHVRVKSINWGPWDSGTGMVTDAAVQQMANMGIGMISPQAGRNFFKQEALLAPDQDIVVIASSLGHKTLEQGTLG